MTTTSSNIVETFASIPFVEASEMRIDFPVQKAVVHNFLRIPQSTFPLLYSSVQMESSRSSTQTMTTTSSNIVETFAWIPLVAASEIRIDFLVQKAVVHNFLRIPKSTFRLLIWTLECSNGNVLCGIRKKIVNNSLLHQEINPYFWGCYKWYSSESFNDIRRSRRHCLSRRTAWFYLNTGV